MMNSANHPAQQSADTDQSEGRLLECESRRTCPFAECLAVMCSDGTWHAQCDELLSFLEPTQWDWMALAGGPALLGARFASFREHHVARQHLRFLVVTHATRRIALIAHDNCGYYAQKYPNLAEDQRRVVQQQQLRVAVRTVRRWHPNAAAEAFMLRGDIDGTCWVEKIA